MMYRSPALHIVFEIKNLVFKLNANDVYLPEGVELNLDLVKIGYFYSKQSLDFAVFLINKLQKPQKSKNNEVDSEEFSAEDPSWIQARLDCFKYEHSDVVLIHGWLCYFSRMNEMKEFRIRMESLGIEVIPFFPAGYENKAEVVHDVFYPSLSFFYHSKTFRSIEYIDRI